MHLFLSEVFQVDFSDQWIVFSTGILALWCILREGSVIEFCFWLPPCLLCFGNEFVVFYLLFFFSLVFRFSCAYDSSSSSSSFSFFLNLFFWGSKEICTNNKKYVKDDKLSNCARKETKTIYNVCLNSKYGEAGAAKN